jgi:arylformamidase
MDAGAPVNVSALTFSTHSGSHADAPFHYAADGIAIDVVDPENYLGLAQVVDARGASGAVTVEDIEAQLLPGVTRVLIRTCVRAPLDVWDSAFTAIDPALIDCLAARGVRLVGVDTPSLDPEASKDMAAHRAVARHGLSILEGLVLDAVPFGIYELIALPLKISGADSSPVRAMLRSVPK